MKETEKHKKAFELYNALGSSRNYDKVAQFLNVSLRNVETWGSEFKWQERLENRDAEIKEKYKAQYEELAETQLKIKLEYAKKFLSNVEKRQEVSDYKEYMGIVGEPDFSVLGIVENVRDQTADASSNLENYPPKVEIVKPEGCDFDE